LHETEAAHQRLDHFTCAALQAHRMQVRILEVTVCAGARLMLLLLDGHDAAWVARMRARAASADRSASVPSLRIGVIPAIVKAGRNEALPRRTGPDACARHRVGRS
jgi:hypothetical protein